MPKGGSSDLESKLLLAPVIATGVGLGVKKIYNFYKSKGGPQKLNNFIANSGLQNSQKILENFVKKEDSNETKVKAEALLQEMQRQQELQKRNEEMQRQQELQKRNEEMQRQQELQKKIVIDELKMKQKMIEEQRLKQEQQNKEIEEMLKNKQISDEEREKLNKMKYFSKSLLLELRKTKKEMLNVEKLLVQIDVLDSELVKEICRLYRFIERKIVEECEKPYIQNKQECINRTYVKYNINRNILENASKNIGC